MPEDGMQINYVEAAARARNQASVYSFMATLLNQRPDDELVANLRAAGGDFICALADEASLTGGMADGFRDMARYVEEKRSDPDQAVWQDLAVDWTRLFRGLSPAYSPTPPYEAVFMGDPDSQMSLIQGINQLYRENGLQVTNEYNDRPDYIGLEFSFLQYLAEAEAQAWEQGNEQLARSHHQAAQIFLRQHLGVWINMFTVPALRFAKTDFYHGFLQICQGVIAEAAA